MNGGIRGAMGGMGGGGFSSVNRGGHRYTLKRSAAKHDKREIICVKSL